MSGKLRKCGSFAHHGGNLRITDDLEKFRSSQEQDIINRVFAKLARRDLVGVEKSIRTRTVAGLRRRGVLTVERST
jgi:hypothetical protein